MIVADEQKEKPEQAEPEESGSSSGNESLSDLLSQEAQAQPAQRDLARPTAHQIFAQVADNARHELARPVAALAIAGVVGGLTMGLTALSTSIVRAELGSSATALFIAHLLYPIGFMAVILGRGQLFTENTLYPVALVLAERRHVGRTLRLWAVVFPSNVAGALLFALLAVKTGALRPEYVEAMTKFGLEAANVPASHVFWSGVFGGWIIALVAWLVSGSHSITGSALLIWVFTFVVGLGQFAHCIATSGEILAAVFTGQYSAAGYGTWLAMATLGNIVGGVMLVTLLEYGQVKSGTS
ncbi:Formate efflux transporter [Acidisarcina polymorpha]|uniref:Formate efflux transporter n=1 Tax=Acidisarcina polymorpha TaxID=2211140 RepID=A0A2Z5FZN9_9BACT|nr:formate/nitrite transporter family protein [Acidisarcina polymorpha]AXC11816.1 Formate efflux transporter [Acidisarcina polymorpha]